MIKTLVIFPFFYLKEVVLGTLLVARDVVSPKQKLAPVLLHVSVDKLSPRQRLVLACLISMTPGTISVGESEDAKEMIIHALYGAHDPKAAIDHLKNKYEPFVSLLPI